MKAIGFERLERGTYKAFLHVQGYSIPITEDVLLPLRELISSPTSTFLSGLVEKVGYNHYIKGMLEEAIQGVEDPNLLCKTLQEDLRQF